MTYEDQVRAAKTPREAMMILARGLDALAGQPTDPWASWGDSEDATPAAVGAVSPTTASPFEAVAVPVDEAEVERIQRQLDVAEQQFEAVRLHGDKAKVTKASREVQGLQARLRLTKNPGKVIPVSGDQVGDPKSFYQVDGVNPDLTGLQAEGIVNGDMVINLPSATEAQKEARRIVAERIDLPGFFPRVQTQTQEARDEIVANFIKGGPLWLYMSGEEGRQMLIDMPMDAKQIMVHDVAAYGDVRVSHEFARDVLKDLGQGIESGAAQDYLNSIVAGAVNDGHMTRGTE